MIYNKFVIEVVLNIQISEFEDISSVNYGNNFNIEIRKSPRIINHVNYLDKYGNVGYYPDFFYTYEEAYKILDLNYVNLKSTYFNIVSVKIVEVFDDVEPPIDVMRRIKIDKITNKE